jgi:hypothetical protein
MFVQPTASNIHALTLSKTEAYIQPAICNISGVLRAFVVTVLLSMLRMYTTDLQSGMLSVGFINSTSSLYSM